MNNIYIKCLSFSYKNGQEIFHDLSVSFAGERINVLMGTSGSGKTTLLKCISGLYDYEGHIYFDDILMDQVPTKDRKLGYITQEFALYPHYDLFHSISYPLVINGTDIDEIRKRTYEISEEFGIRDILSRKPKQVSIGQAQRATLARAMIKRPTICLLDEPLSNVDQQNRQELRLFIKKAMIKNGTTAIYVTHDLEEATAIGDYLYLLDEGQIIIKGTVNDVLFSKNSKVKEFFESLKNEAF